MTDGAAWRDAEWVPTITLMLRGMSVILEIVTMRPYRKPKRAKGPPAHYTEEQIKKYWRNRQSHECRVKRIVGKRMWLIDQLGGPLCRIPGCEDPELTYAKAEIHHKDGRDWSMDGEAMPQERRIDTMIEEYKRDPSCLTVACRSCNGRIGDPRRNQDTAPEVDELASTGTDDVPF